MLSPKCQVVNGAADVSGLKQSLQCWCCWPAASFLDLAQKATFCRPLLELERCLEPGGYAAPQAHQWLKPAASLWGWMVAMHWGCSLECCSMMLLHSLVLSKHSWGGMLLQSGPALHLKCNGITGCRKPEELTMW